MQDKSIDHIEIRIKPASEMRYLTLDDYFEEDGKLVFEIANSGNSFYNKLILVHALIEQMITEYEGISEKAIYDFDIEHEESLEPGLEKDAPYRDAHLLAEGIERSICAHVGVSWKDYEEACDI
jgi:hypothetical protein